ncbi:hypothetical protein D3C81_1495560 [compost metagenome]
MRQHYAVLVEHIKRAVSPDVQAVEQFVKVGKAHGGDRHALKIPRGRRDAAAEADAPLIGVGAVAAGFERAADKHPGVTVEGVGEEVVAVGKIARLGLNQ